MCQGDSMKWLGAMFYWTNNVQVNQHFQTSVEAFVSGGYNRPASVAGGADFAAGTVSANTS